MTIMKDVDFKFLNVKGNWILIILPSVQSERK